MKTKEFIKRVEDLGYKTEVCLKTLRIREKGCLTALIMLNRRFSFETNFINKPIVDETLFNLIVEYVKTPVEDREEEKRFYLKHRWIKGCVIMYLYLNELNGHCYLGDKKCRPHRQKRFTLKEIEDIKEKFDSDLKDFEMIEVKD